MAATHLLYLGVLLFLTMAASTSGAEAFGLPRGVSSADCAYKLQQYATILLSSPGEAAIHLGNTKSCIAGYGGRWDPYTAYQLCIPSWVAFTDNGTLVGEAALQHAAISPGTAVSGFKRLFGIRINDEMVKREADLVPYKFTEQIGRCGIQVETEQGQVMNFLPERVAGILIAELKKMAEARLGHKIGYAVVTAPAHFNDALRSSSIRNEAARLHGGFSAVNVVDEHVAAAAAYRLHEKRGDGKVVLVVHLGGRTTHATKFKFKDGSGRLLQERHDAYLGGDDFTNRVVDYFVELIKEKHHRDIRGDEGALGKLRADCEMAKKALSNREGVLVNVGSVLEQASSFYEDFTRAKFEELNGDLMARVIEMVEMVVLGGAPASQLRSHQDAIDEIILVGGSMRIPMVAQLIEDYFHGRGLIRDEEAVIRGAALLSRPESARYVDECYNGGVSGPLWLAS